MNARTRFLIVGMLVSGVCNTLLNKLQDMQCVENCDDKDPSKREYFEQPVWQTLNMFIGETLCFIAIYIQMILDSYKEEKDVDRPLAVERTSTDDSIELEDEYVPRQEELSGWKIFLFWIPTLCDICGTTLMNVGLIYTSASVYQMLRGAVVLFTGSFSVIFLKRRLLPYHWFSLFLVVLGVTVVGLSSVLFPPLRPAEDDVLTTGAPFALIGVIFVLFAQVFTASQFVIEEKLVEKYNVSPLRAVGLEGIFGLTTITFGTIIFYYMYGIHHPGGYFDIPAGWNQIISFPQIWRAGIAICFSIAFFNYFGLAVTRTVSATARSTIDTSRIVFVWMVSLLLGWEIFSWLQVLGFVILVTGTFIFNNVIDPPSCLSEGRAEERRPLIRRTSEDML
ncbi:9520_t:CDS:2 [Paraglomus brasilianum]|uniref:9520_t:CDS:1 n=1 Tax=Paraglomus brasilianum TaxID=144538 RepID=A0A9N8WQ94_9GLOM|nr:9520_t:CDS:2 [Paraglomus brasilianum]